MQAEPSESQPEVANSQNAKQSEAMTHQSQTVFNEQQQQQQEDQGHGSSQQDNDEGRSGVSSVSRNETVDLNEKQVNLML